MPSRLARLARIAPLAALAVAVPAGAQKETRYVAPSDLTVTSYTEESQGDRMAHVIWVRNASTVPIQVFAFSLRECENVRASCGTKSLKMKVGPGGRAILGRVEPRDANRGFGYRSSFSWRPDSSDVAALKALAGAGDANAQQQLDERATQAAERAATLGNPNYQLDQDALVALGDRIKSLKVDPDSVVVPEERFFLIHEVRIFALDEQGQILGRVRAYRWGIQQQNIVAIKDTIVGQMPGRTKAEFRLAPPAAPVGVELPIIVTAAPKSP